jgi:peptidoglycan/LPS O-acetylase OafA/YrhL
LDLLRTVALGRVLLWHAFAATWMTFFPAMPTMFFVAGTLLEGRAGVGSHWGLVRRRARRILLPFWVYGAAVAAAGLVREPPGWRSVAAAPSALWHAATWIVPVVDPTGSDWHGGWLSTHLWYLRAYLWVLLLAPILARLAHRLALTLPGLAVAVAVVDLWTRGRLPLIRSGPAGVLFGDLLTYGLFVVLGMAHRRRRQPLPTGLLAAGATAAGIATIAYVHVIGLPPGGVNDAYGAVALSGLAWLLAAGAAEQPIRRLAERRAVRCVTTAVTRRAVTVYLWHPAAIVVAYAVLNGSNRFPRMSVVHQWPVPAVLVVLVAVLSTVVAAAALGWVEDIAARRTPAVRSGGRQTARCLGTRVARLAAVVPAVGTALALVVPSLVVPVADGQPAGAAPVVATPPPPSFRAALANDAFMARRAPSGGAGPLGAMNLGTARLDAVLSGWLARHPDIDAVGVGVAVDGRTWTGAADTDGAAPIIGVDDEFPALSMTKTFTTALVVQQVSAGRLALDDPVPSLPALPLQGDTAGITVRQMLDHSSGLIEYTAAPGFEASRPLEARQAVELAVAAGLQSPPGTQVHYANTNFHYLGLLLEQVTGRPYADLLTDLFQAHDLRHSRLGPGGPGWPGFASGGLVSTLGDLTRWGDALFTPGRVVPAEFVRELTTLQENNMALSMWPLCPCGTGSEGLKEYAAVGQFVGFGGLMRFPSGMTMVVRFEPAPDPLDAAILDLGHELERALRGSATGRVVTKPEDSRPVPLPAAPGPSTRRHRR